MRYIDLDTYPRRSHYEYFKSLAYPYVGMTANVDVTRLLAAAKLRGASSFLLCLYAAARAANSVPELRQRMVGDRIAEFDHCNTAHTVAMEDGTFVNCHTDSTVTLEEFLQKGEMWQQEAKNHPGFVSTEEDETSLIFVSCTPWVSFTHVIQPVPIPADSNPRIVFGKYFREGEQTKMPLSIQCNHALVDGRHIGLFYQRFQELADNFL